MTDDEGPPTPKTSGSFAVFAETAGRLAQRLEDVSVIKRQGPQWLIDFDGAAQASTWATELRSMAERFSAWPQLHPETAKLEREWLVPRLHHLIKEGEALIATIPRRDDP